MRTFWKKLNLLYERLVLLVLVLILLIVAYCMYDNWYVFEHTIDKSVAKYKPGTASAETIEDSPITADMVAWLTIDNTNIDYPVMQGTDNTAYLNTDPFGGYSLSGSIFLDSRSAADFSDDYSLIYGHHMEYGKMFGALDAFLDADYLNAHRTGTLLIGRNAEETHRLAVFASMKASARDDAVFNLSQTEIREFIHAHAAVLTDEQDAKILGLSTCAEGDSVSRIVVFCCILD